MGSLDDYYNIRTASVDDIPKIMSFINDNWKKGHILATNRDFFNYEMVVDDKVNFIVACSKEDGGIWGVQGFIPSARDVVLRDLWGVVWKTREKAKPMLGMEIKRKTIMLAGGRHELGVGANPNTSVPILRFYGYSIVRLRHFFILNEQTDYFISHIEHKVNTKFIPYDINVEEITNFDILAAKFNCSLFENEVPYKDSWYINRRYFNYPIYKYKKYLAHLAGIQLLIVGREQEYGGKKVFRIVDLLGDFRIVSKLGLFFHDLIRENSYEYIDIYLEGVDVSLLEDAGFSERVVNDTNIIPNYFSPFERRNIEIWANSDINGCKFFKADGDQDRPS